MVVVMLDALEGGPSPQQADSDHALGATTLALKSTCATESAGTNILTWKCTK